jgi:hypothetical protein
VGQDNDPQSPVREALAGVDVVVVAALENGSLKEISVLLKQFVAFTGLTFSGRAKIISTHFSPVSSHIPNSIHPQSSKASEIEMGLKGNLRCIIQLLI